MRTLRNLVLTLAIALVACRSVPSDVAEAHELSKTESAAAFVLAEDTLNKIEQKSAELNDIAVNKAFSEWGAHVVTVVQAREVVAKYLVDSKAEAELAGAYQTGLQLLVDMDSGFGSITVFWEEMIDDEHAANRVSFLRAFREDIERYRVLERKFDEWISQFRVKD